jgi:hypothetical protein
MGKRMRGAGMAAVGLFAAVAPMVVTQSPASAAQTSASGSNSLTFVAYNDLAVTCSMGIYTLHNTDDANHPFVEFSESLGGDAGCFDSFGTDLVVTYKDTSGRVQTSDVGANALTGGRIGGAATSVNATLTVTFFNCDASRSATCSVVATAAPK